MTCAPLHSCMVIAGEASGDLLAAELVQSLRNTPALGAQPHAPRFFGAGGPRMAAAGVELAFDLTQHAVVGLAEALRHLVQFRRLFYHLLDLACARQPEVIVCVDFSGFNRRWAQALRRRLARQRGRFNNWRPQIVQYVSPQVWASRPGRAYPLARDFDLMLCLFPFEAEWYSQRVPQLRVEYVGHPLAERHQLRAPGAATADRQETKPEVLLLPGSREGELRRHLPVMLGAAERIQARGATRFRLVVPNKALRHLAQQLGAPDSPDFRLQTGGLAEALAAAAVAIASTGTVTLECALFGVPTVALYKTSWSTYQVAKRLVTVPYLAMPNLLAGEPVFPEFIQAAATPDNLATAALQLLADDRRREAIRERLAQVAASLGGPGASARAAAAIARLLTAQP